MSKTSEENVVKACIKSLPSHNQHPTVEKARSLLQNLAKILQSSASSPHFSCAQTACHILWFARTSELLDYIRLLDDQLGSPCADDLQKVEKESFQPSDRYISDLAIKLDTGRMDELNTPQWILRTEAFYLHVHLTNMALSRIQLRLVTKQSQPYPLLSKIGIGLLVAGTLWCATKLLRGYIKSS